MLPANQQPISERTRSKATTEKTEIKSEKSITDKEESEEFLKFGIGNDDDNAQQAQQQPQQRNKQDNPPPVDGSFNQMYEQLVAELKEKQRIIDNQLQSLTQYQLQIQQLSNGTNILRNEHHNESTNTTHKYDSFIEQQLLKEKINNIRKFSGNRNDDVDEWLINIEHDFLSTHVSEDIKLKLVPKSLTNDAYSWYEQNKHRLTSWQIFKMEIQSRFQSSIHKDQKFVRLRERKQQLKETGQQFIDAMEKLCFQVNTSMDEQEKMLHIKAGLKPSLKEKVLEKQPESMKQLRDIIKRIEDIEIMINHNETQVNQQALAPNINSSPYPLNSMETIQYEDNCYAMPFYRNDYYQRNYQSQQGNNRRPYRWNQNRRTGYRYNSYYNQYPEDHRTLTSTNPSSTTTRTNDNNQKKY